MVQRSPGAAVVALILLYGLVLAAFSLPGFPVSSPTGRSMPYLADKPLGEDGFYMLTAAWNLGRGAGLTYNVTGRTTGIQPLATLQHGLVAFLVRTAGGDKDTFARATLALGVLTLAVFAWIASRIAFVLAGYTMPDRAITAQTMALILAIGSYPMFRTFTYGLETGLYLVLIASCVLYTVSPEFRAQRASSWVMLGLLAGVTTLARIDFIVVLAAFLAIAFLSRRASFSHAAMTAAAAIAVASPWFLWVHAVSGRWMPTSGSAQMRLINEGSAAVRTSAVLQALAQHLVAPIELDGVGAAARAVFPGSARIIFWTVAAGIALFAALLIARFAQRARAGSHREFRTVLMSWTGALACLTLVYPLFFEPAYFYQRYTAPLLAITIPLLALGTAAGTGSRLLIHGSAAIVLTAFFGTAFVTLHRGRIGDLHALDAGYIARHLPPGARIGAFQSGVLGYFDENVVNLDGKVNAGALRLPGQTLDDYVDRLGIGYLVDWPGYLAGGLSAAYLQQKWAPCEASMAPSPSLCLRRR